MSTERRNSAVSFATSRKSILGEKTFVKILHGDSKTIILNSFCSCLHLINFIKQKLNLTNEENIDFIDLDGFVKELPLSNKEYAINHLNPTNSYIILRIDNDPQTGEKRYTPILNETKLNSNVLKTITNLNTGKVIPGKDKSKQQRDSKRTTTVQSSANQSSKTSTSSSKKSSKK